jgi:hypothetical protein
MEAKLLPNQGGFVPHSHLDHPGTFRLKRRSEKLRGREEREGEEYHRRN